MFLSITFLLLILSLYYEIHKPIEIENLCQIPKVTFETGSCYSRSEASEFRPEDESQVGPGSKPA